jgi:hypothetical protein
MKENISYNKESMIASTMCLMFYCGVDGSMKVSYLLLAYIYLIKV